MTMMTKNEGNGFSTKDLLLRIMDNQDKSNEKWSTEMKRLYDVQKETAEKIMTYNYAQDKCVDEIKIDVVGLKTNQKNILKVFSTISAFIVTSIGGLFLKLFNK